MSQFTTDELRTALNLDLQKVSPEGLESVVDDPIRGFFTARTAGATLEFAHKQPDLEYWTGVKYYGSGTNGRVRFRRTPMAVAVKTKVTRKRTVRLAADSLAVA